MDTNQQEFMPNPNNQYEITITYEFEDGKTEEDHFIGAKGIAQNGLGMLRIIDKDGTWYDYLPPRIIKMVTRIMEVSLV